MTSRNMVSETTFELFEVISPPCRTSLERYKLSIRRRRLRIRDKQQRSLSIAELRSQTPGRPHLGLAFSSGAPKLLPVQELQLAPGSLFVDLFALVVRMSKGPMLVAVSGNFIKRLSYHVMVVKRS
ncbi:hypothetical protein SELMODRAFT_425604 [Selaginella moellendorffii]|uniref:Uncharacterized protein n=1 Tax=Selaginella moellendorffii TaxID=88036 RepID=D8STN1_SELML|nr:hypothetical protein SELMODRAFT_425604 [Selaginella moellendorffii]